MSYELERRAARKSGNGPRNHDHNGRKPARVADLTELNKIQNVADECIAPVCYVVVDESGGPCDIASYSRFYDALTAAAAMSKVTGHKMSVRAGRKTLWQVRNGRNGQK